jgi:type IV pilus assembly protein PilB
VGSTQSAQLKVRPEDSDVVPVPAGRAPKPSKLGEILVTSGAINQQQLDHALAQQRQLKLPIGQVLLKLNYLNDEALRHALSSQLNVPFIDLDRTVIDRHLSKYISRSYAKRYALVPVAQFGRTLTVAMDDPTNRAVADELQRLTSFTITVVTATSEGIQRSFAKLYETEATPGGPSIAPVASPASSRADQFHVQLDDQSSRRADDLVRQIVIAALKRRCSDIHLEMLATGLRVRFRIDGVLREPDFRQGQATIDQSAREIISRIKILSKLDIAERRRPQDGSFQMPGEKGSSPVDLRVSVIPSYTGESVVIRILDRTRAPKDLSELDLNPAIAERIESLLQRTTGIVLVTGPTGSGKSTTLYSCLMRLHSPNVRILTAEDPVEYVYEELSQGEVNQQIGNTFAMFLRAFLRHDPEIIMIGEIRDEETAEMAFRAAQTGHLLLSTLHTNSAIAALPRLRNLNVESSLIASSLNGVVSQRLVRKICEKCKVEDRPEAKLAGEFFGSKLPEFSFYRGTGCEHCGYTGYQGRMLVADLWVLDDRDRLLIAQDASLETVQESAERTTISMAQDAHDRLLAGRTTLEELVRVLPYTAVIEHRQRYGA